MATMGERQVVGPLGVGALTVTMAVQKEGEPVRAGKRLSARFAADEGARAMLRREATILARLDGRGAPRLIDEGEDALGPYVVMELCAMSRVGSRSASATRLGPEWFDLATRAALGALVRVHEASDAKGPLGVVHGDLSPDNVLVADDARGAAIVDFGLSRFRDDPGPLPGPFRGTLSFAAPEVARGEIPDARSDLFGLAASLLAAAWGQPPRPLENFAAVLAEAAETPIDAYAARASAGLDPRVAEVLCACVRFDPGDRPARARDALDALSSI
jgi:eukaryotic-like serine/threonine-protein kinase